MITLLFLIVIGAFIFFAIICLLLTIKRIEPGKVGVRAGFGGLTVKKLDAVRAYPATAADHGFVYQTVEN